MEDCLTLIRDTENPTERFFDLLGVLGPLVGLPGGSTPPSPHLGEFTKMVRNYEYHPMFPDVLINLSTINPMKDKTLEKRRIEGHVQR